MPKRSRLRKMGGAVSTTEEGKSIIEEERIVLSDEMARLNKAKRDNV